MKRYTVKDVIKMEDKERYLYELDRSGDPEIYYLPLMLLTVMGVSYIHGASESAQLLPLIIGSVTTLTGVGSLAHLFSAGLRSDFLYDKINKIYDIMGDDFKEQVEQERMRQKQEEYGKSR